MEYVWKPFAFVFTSKIDDDLKAILSVCSAIISDSVSNDMIVGTFDKAGADGIPFPEKMVIPNPILIFPKVASFGFERISYFGIITASVGIPPIFGLRRRRYIKVACGGANQG